MSEPIFCEDCKHYRLTLWMRLSIAGAKDFARCTKAIRPVALIDRRGGDHRYAFCVNQRARGGLCGPDARQFEAKP